MTSEVSYFRVGIFVLGGVAVVIGALLLFGVEDVLGPDGHLFETYLDESVEGLDVGSAVKYRGVEVGQVEAIDFVRNQYPELVNLDVFDPFGSYVVVTVQLDPGTFEGLSYEAVFQLFQRESANGLRAILTPKGLTGTAYLEIDYRNPVQYPAPEISWNPRELYLPSTTSTLRRFTTGLDELLTKLVGADIDASFEEFVLLLSSLRATNERVRDLLNDPAVDNMPEEFLATFKSVRDLVERLGVKAERTLDDLAAGGEELASFLESVGEVAAREEGGLEDISTAMVHLSEASVELPDTLAQIRATVRRLDFLVSSQQPDLEALVGNLRVITEKLAALSDLAEEYPSLLLFGEPPAQEKGK